MGFGLVGIFFLSELPDVALDERPDVALHELHSTKFLGALRAPAKNTPLAWSFLDVSVDFIFSFRKIRHFQKIFYFPKKY